MIGYLGPSGTFSHIAAMTFFPDEELKEFATIYSAIMAVKQNEVDSCIVPIENSIEGSVNITLDTIAEEEGLYITGEYLLKICQNLAVKPGTKKADIKKIISHPQAIGQCARLLNNEFKNTKIEFTDSTAKAGEEVKASNGSIGAIISEKCAKLNDLEILIADCGDAQNNFTRFVRLEKQRSAEVSDNDKTSIAFTLENRPGALLEALLSIKEYKINMLKIESRPVKTGLGEYIFFVDIEGNIDNPNIYFALENLRKKSKFFKMLGSYGKQEA